MAYHVFWVIEHRVLNIRMSGEVSLEDFRGSSREVADLMDEAYAKAPAGIIIGIVDLTTANLGAIMRSSVTIAQEISTVIDARVWKAKPGFVILITVSEVAKLLTSVIIRISRQPMTTVGTLDEALVVVGYMYPEMQAELDAFRAIQPVDPTL